MKAKKLIKKINKFKEENGSCYIYIIGSDNFYSSAFVIPILHSGEDVVIHNGCSERKDFKVYETISNKEYRKRLSFMIKEVSHIKKLGFDSNNYIYSYKSDFDWCNTDLWNI